MLNKKFYEDKAEELTKEYLKNNPDLKFIVVYGEDDKGNSIASFKIEEQLVCPVEVREKAFDKGFYDESGNYYTCEHYVPYLKEMHTRGIISHTEKHFKLRDYKKTWWLKADKSE